MKTKIILSYAIITLAFAGCKDDKDESFNDPCGGKAPGGLVSLLISLDDDIKMGQSVVNEIESKPSEYPILDSATNKEAYGHIYRIRDLVLNSGKVYHKNEFPWRIRIIKDDNTLNAFCTPGGYIYFYTGIIKYLDNETQLAGVMGHEIAHADRRHSANQMVKQYGVSSLLSILTGGDPGMLTQLAGNLLLLKYGRDDETDADNYSVRYLYPTAYDPRGAKYFFEKLSAGGGSNIPEFLSTHPNPDNRVANIEATWTCFGARADGDLFQSRYQQFKNSLP